MRLKFQHEQVTISPRAARERERRITSNSPFFEGDIIVIISHDRVLFKKPTLDYNGKTYKFFKHFRNGKFDGWYYSGIVADIPCGGYVIDPEESNEDCKVIYLNEKL